MLQIEQNIIPQHNKMSNSQISKKEEKSPILLNSLDCLTIDQVIIHYFSLKVGQSDSKAISIIETAIERILVHADNSSFGCYIHGLSISENIELVYNILFLDSGKENTVILFGYTLEYIFQSLIDFFTREEMLTYV